MNEKKEPMEEAVSEPETSAAEETAVADVSAAEETTAAEEPSATEETPAESSSLDEGTSSNDGTSSHEPRKNRSFVLRVCAAVLGGLLLCVCGLGIWFAKETTRTITVEVGEEPPLQEIHSQPFLRSLYRIKSVPEDMSTPGDYIARIRFFGFYDKALVIRVRDTEPPLFSVRDVHVLAGVMPSPDDFADTCSDSSAVSYAFGTQPPVNDAGGHKIEIIASDIYGNSAKETANLMVWDDSNLITVDLNRETAEDAVRDAFPYLSETVLEASAKSGKEYTLRGLSDDGAYVWRVVLTDHIPPDAVPQNLCLRLSETAEAEDFFTEITDASPCTVVYETEPDFTSLGIQNITICVTDAYGNAVQHQANLMISELPEEYRVEYGTLAEDAAEVLRFYADNLSTDIPTDESGRIPLGEHTLLCETEVGSYTVRLIAEDTVTPLFEIENREIYTGLPVSAEDFVTHVEDEGNVTFTFEEEPSSEEAGTYTVTVIASDESGNSVSQTAEMTVLEDTEPPELFGVKPLFFYTGQELNLLEEVYAVDNRDGTIEVTVDSSAVDIHTAGSYTVLYTCTDEMGHTVSESALVEILTDTEAPILYGAKNLRILVGETVSFRKGVYAMDAQVGEVAVKVDSSAANTYAAGVYPIYYSCSDPSGNAASVVVYLTVTDLSMAQVDSLADQILGWITTSYMTPYEKAWAIYSWCTSNLQYSTRTSYLMGNFVEGAYSGFTTRSGNCYIYYAVASALLTRAGIENMEIQRNDPNNPHYWNLVKIDGAWYHFDTCPHYAGHWLQSFLLTDAQVRAYSQNEVWGYYNFDPSLYPATP